MSPAQDESDETLVGEKSCRQVSLLTELHFNSAVTLKWRAAERKAPSLTFFYPG